MKTLIIPLKKKKSTNGTSVLEIDFKIKLKIYTFFLGTLAILIFPVYKETYIVCFYSVILYIC